MRKIYFQSSKVRGQDTILDHGGKRHFWVFKTHDIYLPNIFSGKKFTCLLLSYRNSIQERRVYGTPETVDLM